ncbi:MAG: hypothetical protein HOP29_06115 [Phycisphaerales bacterium]|nr:hypothetical protein [Phycisphaerales bacterium]
MKKRLSRVGVALPAMVLSTMVLAPTPSASASTAYGTLNNFDCVNDTGVEAHGFEIELEDIHSRDITYTYDYNHYGIPKITEDNSDPAHPRVTIRYAAARNPDGTWTAFTAVPAGPITPTNGHQFTNPSVNFGGEHFGAGYYGAPTAVRYFWLIDDGTGHLVHGPPVYVSTPTFTYYPPAAMQPAQVQAVIVPPPPPDPPVLQFGEATWVKDIKTTTHNSNKVELTDLVDPDPDDPDAHNWANGEPAEVETEWRILQTEFADANNPKGELAGVPEDLPGGDEIITRRYEFYKYIGPLDAESGEAMADEVAPDGIHGAGSVTFNDHFDPVTGEWVEVTLDLSTVEVVGDFFGAQMAGFDIAPALGLIDHIPDGELGVASAERTVVVSGGAAFLATVSGSLPDGTTLDEITGIFSGTPTAGGAFTFTVEASDTGGAVVSKTYTVTIPEGAPVTSTIATSASPVDGGSTVGDGVYANGTPVTVVATHSPGFAFVNWTEDGVEVSASEVYPFTVNMDRTLVAHFIPGGCTVDADCVDADACTTERCVDGICERQPIADCCNVDGQCDDGMDCTLDACTNHVCTHNPIADCCMTNADCTDADACTTDVCVSGICDHQPIADCCNVDAECDDGDDCTRDLCENHVCTQDAVPDCCNTDAECADANACTLDACVDHQCQNTAVVGCCLNDGDCDDGDPCTGDACQAHVCPHDPIVGCCTADAQCADTNPCTLDVCNLASNQCAHQLLPECCIDDADCADTDICTIDVCVNQLCEHNRIADCCATDEDCSQDDPPPTFDNCVDGDNELGCNPDAVAGCDSGVTASDRCGKADVTCTSDDAVDGCVHTRTLTYAADDGCSNTATCVQIFTWTEDVSGPAIECPADLTVECDGQDDSAALDDWLNSTTASDACGSVTIGHRRDDDGCDDGWHRHGGYRHRGHGDVGHADVQNFTWTATDACGNASTCSATFTTVDTTLPVVTVAEPGPVMWPPNHKYRMFQLSDCAVTVVDGCDGTLDVDWSGTIDSIYSDEPENAKGDGDGSTRYDIVILGRSWFMLRAERGNAGNGRVYGISFTVGDKSGNVTPAVCRVRVPHDQSGAPAIDDGPAAGYTVLRRR